MDRETDGHVTTSAMDDVQHSSSASKTFSLYMVQV